MAGTNPSSHQVRVWVHTGQLAGPSWDIYRDNQQITSEGQFRESKITVWRLVLYLTMSEGCRDGGGWDMSPELVNLTDVIKLLLFLAPSFLFLLNVSAVPLP